jgi:hypothetical protein
VVLLLALPACSSGTKADAGPTASVTAPPTTVDPQAAVKAEVEAAYLKSWDVYAEAMADLRTDGLPDAYAGDQLARTRADVERRIADGRRARFSVEHHYVIEMQGPDLAAVKDDYINHSVVLAQSGEPAEPDPNTSVSETYTLARRDGRWLVTDIVGS